MLQGGWNTDFSDYDPFRYSTQIFSPSKKRILFKLSSYDSIPVNNLEDEAIIFDGLELNRYNIVVESSKPSKMYLSVKNCSFSYGSLFHQIRAFANNESTILFRLLNTTMVKCSFRALRIGQSNAFMDAYISNATLTNFRRLSSFDVNEAIELDPSNLGDTLHLKIENSIIYDTGWSVGLTKSNKDGHGDVTIDNSIAKLYDITPTAGTWEIDSSSVWLFDDPVFGDFYKPHYALADDSPFKYISTDNGISHQGPAPDLGVNQFVYSAGLIQSVVTVDSGCNDGKGSILLEMQASNKEYEFSLDKLNYQNEPRFDDLPSGEYIVYIRTSDNCSHFQQKVFLENECFLKTICKGVPESKFAQGDGEVYVEVQNNIGTPEYLWDDFDQTEESSVSDLRGGIYSVTVNDVDGSTSSCSVELLTPLTAWCISNPCENTVEVSRVEGGVPPYSYEWNNGNVSPTLIYANGGNYSVTVTDAVGNKTKCNTVFYYQDFLNEHDLDEDGMSSEWEIAHGLDECDPSDAFCDEDNDSVINLFEFQMGTDPHDGSLPNRVRINTQVSQNEFNELLVTAHDEPLLIQMSEGVYDLEFSDEMTPEALKNINVMFQGGWNSDFSEHAVDTYKTEILGTQDDQPFLLLDKIGSPSSTVNKNVVIIDGCNLSERYINLQMGPHNNFISIYRTRATGNEKLNSPIINITNSGNLQTEFRMISSVFNSLSKGIEFNHNSIQNSKLNVHISDSFIGNIDIGNAISITGLTSSGEDKSYFYIKNSSIYRSLQSTEPAITFRNGGKQSRYIANSIISAIERINSGGTNSTLNRIVTPLENLIPQNNGLGYDIGLPVYNGRFDIRTAQGNLMTKNDEIFSFSVTPKCENELGKISISDETGNCNRYELSLDGIEYFEELTDLDTMTYSVYVRLKGTCHNLSGKVSIVEDCTISSINELAKDQEILCYPNPTYTDLNIKLFQKGTYNILILKSDGALQMKSQIINSDHLELDIKYFIAGLYFILVINPETNEQKMTKFFKI